MTEGNVNRRGTNRKVLLIGLDGASPELIAKWVKEGELRTIGALKFKGAFGRLRCVPQTTPPSWTSIATGKNPGKHGIYDFFKPSPNNRSVAPFSNEDRKCGAIWNILSEAGLKVVVMNYPMTFPPDPINGVMVSGIPGTRDGEFTYPRSFKSKLLREFPDYDLYPSLKFKEGGEDAFIRSVEKVCDVHYQAALYLMAHVKWDCFICTFMGIDWISHFFWKHMEAGHHAHEGSVSKKHGKAVLDIYKRMDRMVQGLIREAGDGTSTIVVSDHGFGPFKGYVHMNNWLLERGYLRIKKRWLSSLRAKLFTMGLCENFYHDLAKSVAMNPLFLKVKSNMSLRPYLPYLTSNDIDYSSTMAFSFGQLYPIQFNFPEIKGRVDTAYDSMSQSERERLRADLEKDLLRWHEPEPLGKMVKKVIPRSEMFCGQYLSHAPDLHLIPDDPSLHFVGYTKKDPFMTNRTFTPPDEGQSGTHRVYGTVIMSGWPFKKGSNLTNMSNSDITPTILYLLGLPVADDMDGRIPFAAIKDDLVYDHPHKRVATYEKGKEARRRRESKQAQPTFSSKERNEALRKLKELGYWT